MGEAVGQPALVVRALRDGAVRTFILAGELDAREARALLTQAAITIDDQAERLVLDLAGVVFLDCAGARALAIAVGLAPAGCPVIVRSLSPEAARFLELLGLNLENPLAPLAAGA
jgi:anti-anti-sigma factor